MSVGMHFVDMYFNQSVFEQVQLSSSPSHCDFVSSLLPSSMLNFPIHLLLELEYANPAIKNFLLNLFSLYACSRHRHLYAHIS